MENNSGRLVLLFAFGILLFAFWSNVATYAQNGTAAVNVTSSSSSSPKPPSEQQHVSKVKITSPTKDQQVPVGKDLTVSGTSIDNAAASTNDCKVSVIVNKVRPYQPATPAAAAGAGSSSGSAGATDYSKWNFVLTSKYTTIKPGPNRITAKYECVNNPALTSFSSVNVSGVQAVSPQNGIGSITSIVPQAVNGANQRQQTSLITMPPAPASRSLSSQLPKQTDSSKTANVASTTNMPTVV